MPFIQRYLEPINVSRVEVKKSIKNELECVTNHTLSNIIRQLSSLSKHAEDMFNELSIEVKTFTDRTQHLQGRIDHLRKKVKSLDAAAETLGSIHELHLKMPFKSSTIYDQQVVSRSTIPRCILKAYSQCDPIPALNKLNHYRDDGRDSVKFYTDPGYFFELWLLDIQRNIENKKIELKSSHTKDNLQPFPPSPLSEVDYPRWNASKKIIARVSTALQPSPEKQEDDSTVSLEEIRTILPAPQAPPPPPINTKMVPTNAFSNKNPSVQAELLSLKRKSTLVGGGSNFLEQIRGGIHLRHLDDIMKRKVNENEKGIFKKSTPDGNFDVHSIMNRAFEMRRKVIEESEEEDGSSSDNEWD